MDIPDFSFERTATPPRIRAARSPLSGAPVVLQRLHGPAGTATLQVLLLATDFRGSLYIN